MSQTVYSKAKEWIYGLEDWYECGASVRRDGHSSFGRKTLMQLYENPPLDSPAVQKAILEAKIEICSEVLKCTELEPAQDHCARTFNEAERQLKKLKEEQ